MTELKRCPFCGGEAYIEEESDSFSTVQYVARCKNCLVDVRIDADMTKSFEWNKQKVIEKWNNRTNPWHTGKPIEEGWYLIKFVMGKKGEEEVFFRTEKYKPSLYCTFDNMKWQKIEDKEDGKE